MEKKDSGYENMAIFSYQRQINVFIEEQNKVYPWEQKQPQNQLTLFETDTTQETESSQNRILAAP